MDLDWVDGTCYQAWGHSECKKDEQGFHMEQLNSGEIPIKNHLGPLRRQKDQQGFHMKSFEFLQNSGEIPFFFFPHSKSIVQVPRLAYIGCV